MTLQIGYLKNLFKGLKKIIERERESVCVCLSVCVYVCVCLCVCARVCFVCVSVFASAHALVLDKCTWPLG